MITVNAYRTGLTARADVLYDGEVVMSVRNVFTVRGARQEGERIAEQLASGEKTIDDILREDQAGRRGWGCP